MIPYLQIKWNFNGSQNIVFEKEPFENNSDLSISFEKNSFDFNSIHNENREVLIFGNTVINDKIEYEKILKFLLDIKLSNIILLKEYILQINGQFLILILDKKQNELFLINDRFNGIPIYFSQINNSLIISHLYFDLFKYLRGKKEFKFNQDTIIEFLWFNRVFGSATYDNLSEFMKPANIININSNKLV